MEKITCIIVDDEPRARNVLSNLLSNYFSQIEVVGQAKDVLEAVEVIKKLKPNVVFLDVQMPNYAGYEIIQFFEKIDFEIIFVTAYDQYAIKAFELSAIDYLVKPVNGDRLKEAIEKLKTKLERTDKILDYKNLLDSMKNETFETIILPELGLKRMVKLVDIVAVEANGSYSDIHLIGGEQITISKNMKYFENLLPENNFFFRTHRSWVINIKLIASFNQEELEINHKSGLQTKLARRKLIEFKALFITNSSNI